MTTNTKLTIAEFIDLFNNPDAADNELWNLIYLDNLDPDEPKIYFRPDITIE